jgi:hypothetical protein
MTNSQLPEKPFASELPLFGVRLKQFWLASAPSLRLLSI